jgi:hypothetical protein
VKNEVDLLEQPCWVMLINVVAMDMLRSKIPPGAAIVAALVTTTSLHCTALVTTFHCTSSNCTALVTALH